MSLIASTIQFRPVWGSLGKNREAILLLMEKAVMQKAQVITLPEMCTTGYVFANQTEIDPYCEDREGETFQLMADFCKTHSIHLVYGFAERDGTHFYNSQNLIDPAGRRLATYRKTHLFEQDFSWALPGDSGFITVDTEIGRLGLGICMDLNFNDFVRFHIRQQTDLVCFSACWLDEDIEITPYWQNRLKGFTNAICIANSFGEERGTCFRGQSTVVHRGQVVAQASLAGEDVLITLIE